MSEENVEIVRRLMDAWNRQDLEGILALIDPEAEYVNAPTAVEPGTRRGHDEIVVVMRKLWEGIPNALQEIDRLHDRGDEIITEGRLSRTMPGSDVRISNRLLISWKFRDRKLIRLERSVLAPNFLTPSKPPGLRSRPRRLTTLVPLATNRMPRLGLTNYCGGHARRCPKRLHPWRQSERGTTPSTDAITRPGSHFLTRRWSSSTWRRPQMLVSFAAMPECRRGSPSCRGLGARGCPVRATEHRGRRPGRRRRHASEGRWRREWGSDRNDLSHGPALSGPEDRLLQVVHRPRRRPRSRGAAGVKSLRSVRRYGVAERQGSTPAPLPPLPLGDGTHGQKDSRRPTRSYPGQHRLPNPNSLGARTPRAAVSLLCRPRRRSSGKGCQVVGG